MHIIRGSTRHRAAVLRIVRSLPASFARSALTAVQLDLRTAPFLIARDGRAVVGFAVTERRRNVWEILWIGVAPAYQRRGIGAALVQRIEREARRHGVRMIEVKTISDVDPSPEFRRTRRFWSRQGFVELDRGRLPDWDPDNPAVILVKIL